jgi:choline dehydrogenase-like flavoprotein
LVNPHIGANLHLHPVTVVYGIFDHPIRGWEGAPMTRVSRQFANLDGQGYGVRLETAPVHPGIAALSLPWETGQQHRATMAQLAFLSNIIIITRDRYGGMVTVDRRGSPVLNYRLHQHDARHMMRGILEALKTQRAAGAQELSSPHARRLVWREDDGWKDFESYLAAVEAAGLKANTFSLFSAHQMSSARIGGSMATGAVDPSGETYEVRHLYVADASAMPTATGVNPMISIMATAHYLAQHMKTRI